MKKYLVCLVFMSVVMFLVGAVDATSSTLIAGKIYNADFSETISNASVIVTCNGTVMSTISLDDGSYSVTYLQADCAYGSDLSVAGTKGDLHGYSEGVINDDAFMGWDLAIVNVPLVPEFGVFVGFMTLLSAIGVFFFVRRE